MPNLVERFRGDDNLHRGILPHDLDAGAVFHLIHVRLQEGPERQRQLPHPLRRRAKGKFHPPRIHRTGHGDIGQQTEEQRIDRRARPPAHKYATVAGDAGIGRNRLRDKGLGLRDGRARRRVRRGGRHGGRGRGLFHRRGRRLQAAQAERIVQADLHGDRPRHKGQRHEAVHQPHAPRAATGARRALLPEQLPAVAVALVVDEVLLDRPRLAREALQVGVGQLAVAAVPPGRAERVADDEVAATRVGGTVHVPHDQQAVPPLPFVDGDEVPLGVRFGLGEGIGLAVAALEKIHRHDDRHRAPLVRSREKTADFVHVVRRAEPVEPVRDPPLFRVFARLRRKLHPPRRARPEDRRRLHGRVRPQDVTAHAIRLQGLETGLQQASRRNEETFAHGLLEPRQVG